MITRCPPLHRLSPNRGSTVAVFKLAIDQDAGHPGVVQMWWKYLPVESEGIGLCELALLAIDAMRSSSFGSSLHFETRDNCVRAEFDAVLDPRELAALHFRDFYFESRATHASDWWVFLRLVNRRCCPS